MPLCWLMSQVTAFHLVKAPKRENREFELHPWCYHLSTRSRNSMPPYHQWNLELNTWVQHARYPFWMSWMSFSQGFARIRSLMLCVLPSCCQLCVNTWRRLSHLLQKKQYQCACLGWCHKRLHSILPKCQSAGVANSSFTPDDTILALAAEILCHPITSEIWNWTHECNMQDIHVNLLNYLSVRVLREFVRRCCVLPSCCQLCVNTWRRLVQNVRGPIFHFEFNTVVISFNFLLSVWAFGQFVLRWQRKISSSSVGEPACAFILDLG